MAIQLTKEELWAVNILSSETQNVQAELQRTLSAKDALIKLLEIKYGAKFDPETGMLEKVKKG